MPSLCCSSEPVVNDVGDGDGSHAHWHRPSGPRPALNEQGCGLTRTTATSVTLSWNRAVPRRAPLRAGTCEYVMRCDGNFGRREDKSVSFFAFRYSRRAGVRSD